MKKALQDFYTPLRIKITATALLISMAGYSQFKTDLSPMVNFHSTNATTLGQFGDTPVSLYTGTPNISIPIHKLSERGVEMDINMQYNAKGVRVEDVPGWVGQNWALNAGGVITRSVRGTAFDELNFFIGKDPNHLITPEYVEWATIEGDGFYQEVFQRGYYYHASKLSVPNWNSPAYLYDLAYNSYFNFYGLQNQPATFRQQNFRMDLEPDLFTFNFMGHTGHFFLGQDGRWKVFSDSNLRVECDMSADISYPVPPVLYSDLYGYGPTMKARFPKVINKITLVDDRGTRYLFDQVELTFNSIYSQRPGLNNGIRCISSAFYLTKVTDVKNNLLYQLEYEKGPWQGKFSVSFDYSFLKADLSPERHNTSISQFNPTWDWHDIGFGAPGQLILPSYLKKIKTESGIEVDFNSQLVERALKYERYGNSLFDNRYASSFYGMQVQMSGAGDFYFLYKEPDMVTDSNSTEDVWNRLKNKKLMGIKIKDNSNNEIDVNFDYFDISGFRLILRGFNLNGTKKYKFDYKSPNLGGFLDLSTDRLGYFNNIPFRFTDNYTDYNYWKNELPALRATNENVLAGSLYKITYPTGGFTEFEFEPHAYSKSLNDSNVLVNDNGIIGGLRIKKISNFFDNSVETKEYLYKKSLTDNTSSGILLYNPIYFKDSGPISHPLNNIHNGRYLVNRSLGSIVTMSNFMGVQLEYTDVIEKRTGNGYTHYKFSNYEDFPDYNPIMLHEKALPFVPKTDRSYERGSLKEKFVYKEGGSLLQKTEYKYRANSFLAVNAVNINFNYNIGCLGCTSALGSTYWLLPFTAAYQISYTDKSLIEETSYTYSPLGTMYTHKTNNYVRYPQSPASAIANNGSIFKKYDHFMTSELNMGILKTFQYPFELDSDVATTMVDKNVLPVIGEKTQKIHGDPLDPNSVENLDEKKLEYELHGYAPLPKESFFSKGDGSFEKEFLYSAYDSKGNITEYKKDNGIPISVIWGYNQTKPIAILENVEYSTIPQQTIANLVNLSNQDVDSGVSGTTENALRNALNALRTSFPNAMIKTYTYDPLSGITSGTEYNGDAKYHEYDDLLRLIRIRDRDGNILQEFEYKYRPEYNPED